VLIYRIPLTYERIHNNSAFNPNSLEINIVPC
jgi:hypothetical protein